MQILMKQPIRLSDMVCMILYAFYWKKIAKGSDLNGNGVGEREWNDNKGI